MALNKEQYEVLTQLFEDLSDTQKQDFIKSLNIKTVLNSNSTQNTQTKEEYLKEAKTEIECPFCHSKHIVKNGKKDGKQRFACNDCGKTFGYTENTILKCSRLSMDTLTTYIHCMVEKKSLRECTSICNISLPTAFTWRHKILDALQNMQAEVNLNGIVESDETFTSISFKGNHKNSNFRCLV